MFVRSLFLALVGCVAFLATLMVPGAAIRIIETPHARFLSLPLIGVPVLRHGHSAGIVFVALGLEIVSPVLDDPTADDERLERLGVDATYDAALAAEGGMTNSKTVDVAVLREAVIARLAVDASHVRVRNIYVFQNEFRTRNELRELASNER